MNCRLPLIALASIVVAVSLAGRSEAVVLPPGFVAENVYPGYPAYPYVQYPVQIAFLPDGRMLVATKYGRVWVIKNGVVHTTPLWDGHLEVQADVDRGLTGVAVDPDFPSNRYLYFFYTVDPDSNGAFGVNEPVFDRLTRYRLSETDSNRVDPSTRTVLIGRTWTEGAVNTRPSHATGSLRWGRDGSLLVSIGDGAHWNVADKGGLDPTAFGPGRTDPSEDIGAFRAQNLNSLCGKVLRINPHTGYGYASNPYADDNLASVRSRVYEYGLRNAYRFVVRPGTGNPDTTAGDPGVLYLGDVGWNTWEDIDVADQPGINFGWPCYEGFLPNTAYQNLTPANYGCPTIGTPINPGPLRDPIITWHHVQPTLSSPPGYTGYAAIGGEFYTGYRYPAVYRGSFFYGDFGGDWIARATMNPANQLVGVTPFAPEAPDPDYPVDIELDPWTGDLYYLAMLANQVRHIRYLGDPGNQPPTGSILSPADGSFYATGDALPLAGSGSDTEDPASALVFQWRVDRSVDGVIQRDAQRFVGESAEFVAGDSPTGYEAHLVVYDTDGKSDTTQIVLHPEVDLEPSPVVPAGENIWSDQPSLLQVTLWNHGRMASPTVRWRLLGDDVLLAEGDTVFAAQDTVLLERWVAPVLSEGSHLLSVVVDALGSVPETNESNNTWSGTVTVAPFAGSVGVAEQHAGDAVRLSAPFPNPSADGLHLALELPASARTEWQVYDLHGREVWAERARPRGAGTWTLSWNGEDDRGRRMQPGLYFARVSVGTRTFVRRVVLMR